MVLDADFVSILDGVVLKTVLWEESASERRTLSMLGRLQDWTTLMRRGTQVYMRDPLKPDIMGTTH